MKTNVRLSGTTSVNVSAVDAKAVDGPKAANAATGPKAVDGPKAANAVDGPDPKMMKTK